MSPTLQHQIRNKLAVIIGGIETENFALVRQAARQLDALCVHLDALVIQEVLDETEA